MWWHWHTEPELIGGLLLVAWFYAIYTGPLRSRIAPPNTPYPLGSAITFYSGLILFYLTVGSPIDFVGEVYLFSVHMFQHILLMYLVPVVLILGLPGWLTRPLLQNRFFGPIFRFCARPLVAGGMFIFFLSLWHVPTFYEAALQNRLLHNIEHMTMFLPGFFVWWLVFSRSKEVPALGFGGQILFIFLLSLAKIPVATFLTFSREILYPTYEFAPRITDLSAIDDQILGGVLKVLVAKFAGVFIIAYSFYRWYQEHLKEERAQDAALHSSAETASGTARV